MDVLGIGKTVKAWRRSAALGLVNPATAPPVAITGAQTAGGLLGAGLPAFRSQAGYATYRQMRKHPTIALARAMAVAPIVAARWSVEADGDAPAGAADLVADQFLSVREPLVEQAMLGGCDFGWQPWEKIFGLSPDGHQVIRRFKPLLQDITQVESDQRTGAFCGFTQDKAAVPLANCLLVSFRVEGTDWRGQALLENAREAWDQWREANAGAARYDRKIAGSHWVVYYPLGRSRDAAGTERDNSELAQWILNTLESSGSVAIPDDVAAFVDGMNAGSRAWKVEILSDQTPRQPTFIERLNYLDRLLVRAILMPERAILEGQHGTLAEATAHADAALQHAELQHRHVTRLINWHAVDQVLALNWGGEARGKVRLVASPILDERLSFLREVYRAVLASPSGFLEEFGLIDTAALKESLGVPKSQADGPLDEIAVPGMDVNDPQAAMVRGVYGDGSAEDRPVESAGRAASQAEVQGTALNGAQIASIVDICAKVAAGELTKPAAAELIAIAFPLLEADRVSRLMGAIEIKPAAATTTTTI